MTHLDLFSGIGGFALAARWAGMKTIAFCEIEPFPQKVLAKNFPGVPIFDDIRKLHAKDLPERPDVITGGYPCQPFSLAGKRGGAEDDRHLWPEMFRIVRECHPTWVIGENVAGHVSMGLDQVLTDLESESYATRTFDIPAVAVDAPHRRHRLWIVAHSKGIHAQGQQSGPWEVESRGGCWWPTEPDVGRVAHGIPNRVDRLKGLGNAIVPQVAYEILRCLY